MPRAADNPPGAEWQFPLADLILERTRAHGPHDRAAEISGPCAVDT
jgi:hypothetical protein